jgi:hypothetical protein
MIDLSTVQIISAIPEKILALEAANTLLSSDNQALISKNETLKKLSITLGFILVCAGIYQLLKHLNKKDEEIENKMPALKNQATPEK